MAAELVVVAAELARPLAMMSCAFSIDLRCKKKRDILGFFDFDFVVFYYFVLGLLIRGFVITRSLKPCALDVNVHEYAKKILRSSELFGVAVFVPSQERRVCSELG